MFFLLGGYAIFISTGLGPDPKLAGLEQQARGLKTAINALLELSGAPKRYSKAEDQP